MTNDDKMFVMNGAFLIVGVAVVLLSFFWFFSLPGIIVGGLMIWAVFKYYREVREAKKHFELERAQETIRHLEEELDSRASCVSPPDARDLPGIPPTNRPADRFTASPVSGERLGQHSMARADAPERPNVIAPLETDAQPWQSRRAPEIKPRQRLRTSDTKCEVATKSRRRCLRMAKVTLNGRLLCEMHANLHIAGKGLTWHTKNVRAEAGKCEVRSNSGRRCVRWAQHVVDGALRAPCTLGSRQ